jgi:hypothetical protein
MMLKQAEQNSKCRTARRRLTIHPPQARVNAGSVALLGGR